jgi:prespore-specific regulator
MRLFRQEPWSEDDSLILAEVVLRYLREGESIEGAFEEISYKISRKVSECKLRWKEEISKKYENEIQIAYAKPN